MFLILTTADTEIQALAAAVRRLPEGFTPVQARHANVLVEPEALDRLIAEGLETARAVVVRVLGGRADFAEGFERLSTVCDFAVVSLILVTSAVGTWTIASKVVSAVKRKRKLSSADVQS